MFIGMVIGIYYFNIKKVNYVENQTLPSDCDFIDNCHILKQ